MAIGAQMQLRKLKNGYYFKSNAEITDAGMKSMVI